MEKVMLQCPLCVAKTAHSFVSEHGDYNELYKVHCDACGVDHTIPRKDWFSWIHNTVSSRKTYLTSYPRLDPVLGVMVSSKDHAAETAKRMGYREQHHAQDARKTERKKIKVDRGLW